MYKAACILLLLSLRLLPLSGQDSLSIPDWVERRRQLLGLDDPAIESRDFRASWVRNMELRTETEDFELDKQEYLFRLSPSTPRIRRAQTALIALLSEEAELDQVELRGEIRKYLLGELLEIRAILAELDIQAQLLAVYRDEQQLIRNLITDQRYNVKDLLEAEEAIQELELEIAENRLRIRALAGANLLPATGGLVSPDSIPARLAALGWTALNAAADRRNQLATGQLEAEILLEKAEKNRVLDFVQVRYNGPHTDLWGERLAVSLALQLPYSAAKKAKLEELRVEQLMLDQELRHQRALDSLKTGESLDELNIQIASRQRLGRQLEDQLSQLNRLREQGVDVAYDSPELLLFQQETVLKSRLQVLKVEGSIYRAYLDLLEWSGLLGEEAGLRYLLKRP